MAPEIVGEHEGVVQNGEKKIAGFSEKYNPTQDYTVSKLKTTYWNVAAAKTWKVTFYVPAFLPPLNNAVT